MLRDEEDVITTTIMLNGDDDNDDGGDNDGDGVNMSGRHGELYHASVTAAVFEEWE